MHMHKVTHKLATCYYLTHTVFVNITYMLSCISMRYDTRQKVAKRCDISATQFTNKNQFINIRTLYTSNSLPVKAETSVITLTPPFFTEVRTRAQ